MREEIIKSIVNVLVFILEIVVIFCVFFSFCDWIIDKASDKESEILKNSKCNHEWEYIGHKYSTSAICKKCYIEVDANTLIKYYEKCVEE